MNLYVHRGLIFHKRRHIQKCVRVTLFVTSHEWMISLCEIPTVTLLVNMRNYYVEMKLAVHTNALNFRLFFFLSAFFLQYKKWTVVQFPLVDTDM